MHKLTVNILEMLTDEENTTISINKEVMHGLSIGIFTIDHDPF